MKIYQIVFWALLVCVAASAHASAHASAPVAVLSTSTSTSTPAPTPREGSFTLRNFTFKSGETLSSVTLHYYTFGTPRRDASGRVANAVLILHGTGGSGRQFLTPDFAGVLFGSGQLLDASRYFMIIPDNLGHGGSSKPSDGLHMRFPRYEYDDMVELQYRLVTQGLGVDHLRLVMGTSMGGMHTWLWAEQHPGFMDALMPLASLPAEIGGRNRIWRKMIIDSIRNDPAWKGGEYAEQPHGLACALNVVFIMCSSSLQLYHQAPARDQADANLAAWLADRLKTTDANDMLYYYEASRNYNPAPALERITAPLTAINFSDDVINPPEMGIIEREIKRVRQGQLVLFPITNQTRGHATHSFPALWREHLAALLHRSEPKP